MVMTAFSLPLIGQDWFRVRVPRDNAKTAPGKWPDISIGEHRVRARVFVELIDNIVVRIIKSQRVSQYAASEKGTCFVSALRAILT